MWLLYSGLYHNYIDLTDEKIYRKFFNNMITIAAIYDDNDILDWLKSQTIDKDKGIHANDAVKYKAMNLLQWLCYRKVFSLL